jgi:predicted secreted protein
MIRTLAVAAAIAALPALAAAQTDYGTSSHSNVTVLHQRPDQYSIILDVTGRDPQTVRREIWNFAYTACRRAPRTGNVKELTVDAQHACVSQAQSDAMLQYNQIMGR